MPLEIGQGCLTRRVSVLASMVEKIGTGTRTFGGDILCFGKLGLIFAFGFFDIEGAI